MKLTKIVRVNLLNYYDSKLKPWVEAKIKSAVNALNYAIQGDIQYIDTKLTSETDRALSAEANLQGKYTAEENRAKEAEKALQSNIDNIESLIPTQATEDNQLADKDFVNSSITTNTAIFKGTFTSLQELQSTEADTNDYAILITTDDVGNTVYNRYKYSDGWGFEFALNNSSFTSDQWKSINSNMTTELTDKLKSLPNANVIGNKADKSELGKYLPLSGGTMSNTTKVDNLNADMVDGHEGDWYINNNKSFNTYGVNSVYLGDANTKAFGGGIIANYASPTYWINAPTGIGYGCILELCGADSLQDNNSNPIKLAGQLAWDSNHASETPTHNLWWRSRNSTGWGNDWKQIAFVEDVTAIVQQASAQSFSTLVQAETATTQSTRMRAKSQPTMIVEAGKQYYNDEENKVIPEYNGFSATNQEAKILSKYPMTFAGENVIVENPDISADYLMYTLKYMQISEDKYLIAVSVSAFTSNGGDGFDVEKKKVI